VKRTAEDAEKALKAHGARFAVLVVLGCQSRVTDEDVATLKALYHVFGTAYLRKVTRATG